MAQSDANAHLYLPLIMGNSAHGAAQPAAHLAQASPIQATTWSTYTSTKGGYSLRYPSDWKVEEGIKGTLVITDPSGQWADRITVIYLDFEKPETAKLATWAEDFFALGLGPDLVRTFSSITLAIKDPTGTSQQVYMQYASPIPGAGYLITHGRLVLQISTDSASTGLADQLQTVANSVAFAENGPTDQAQLSAPEKVPAYITIEAWQQRMDDLKMAAAAVRYRLQTGEIDTDRLAKMSDNAKKDYERLLADAADYISEMDKQRRAQATPTPSVTPNPGVNSPEFVEQERIYNEGLEKTGTPESTQSQGRLNSSSESSVEAVATVGAKDIANRRGLPARVTTPIRIYPFNNVFCYSDQHYGKDTYAIDIMVGEGTAVYGTTQNETVIAVETNPVPTGFGKFVETTSQLYVRGVNKLYYHIYAHLSRVDVAVGNLVQPNTQIGLSGNTGSTGGSPHLHFQIHTHFEVDGDSGSFVPVDLSPIKGFTPNLSYPLTGVCGIIEDPTNAPIIIEANEFTSSYQPVSGGINWTCSTFFPNHTGTCYRAVVPVTPEWGLDQITYSNQASTPKIAYQVYFPTATNYRVWVCGMGGNINDDSLHMGQNSLLFGTADQMTGYNSSNWVWKSLTMDSAAPTPYLYLNQGYNNIDAYGRENGMRMDRILLTKNYSYNPTTAGIRCGAQGL